MTRTKLSREADPYLEGIKNRAPSRLESFSDVMNKLGEESRQRAEISRAAFAKLDQEIPLNPSCERIIDLVYRHHNAIMRLSGTSVPPRNDDELIEWCKELREVRAELNKLAMMQPEGR